MVTSGIALPDRRREVAILKATGWQMDQILLRATVEGFTLSTLAVCLSVLGAWFWLGVLNGYAVAAIFLPGGSAAAEFPIPYRLTPIPVLLALVVSLAIVLSGSLFASWRAAAAEPREALR
jgi:ABC-type lipoprotein release transport system permease subunit